MFTTFSSASIADFEQANVCWHVTIETLCKVYCNSDIKTQKTCKICSNLTVDTGTKMWDLPQFNNNKSNWKMCEIVH